MNNARTLYTALLKLYPCRYRQAFGTQMLQTFLDHYQDMVSTEKRMGLAFWWATICDEIPNIVRQRVTAWTEERSFLQPSVETLAQPRRWENMSQTILATGIPGLKRFATGKVRDVYELGDALLLVATDDRTIINWLTYCGVAVTDELEAALAGRCMVGMKTQALPLECVVRGYLAGSLWKEYVASGGESRAVTLHGIALPAGLHECELIWIDEALTPDSSRFWDADIYQPGRSQPSFDKQFVRDWLESSGWNEEPSAPVLPPDIVVRTSEKYREAYRRLAGQPLSDVP